MFLNDEQILNMLTDYVEDKRYKQAVLIDGEWGSGKTFFVKKKLLKEIEKKFEKSLVGYISLYGLMNHTQIMDEIYSIAFEDLLNRKLKVGEKKGKKIIKGVNLTSKIILAGLKHFNIDSKDLPSLEDIMKIKDAVIIFDDLERCNMDINQLLGFINNLVENNSIKVILVANQSEIGKINVPVDLPYKYLVALDSRIILDNENGENKFSANKEEKSINKGELISRTNKIFSEDILYQKIKEKLIGLTIYYEANLYNIYESVVEEYLKDEKAKKQLIEKKQVVLKIFENKQHCNVRTLIFGMIAYEKFFKIVDTIKFEPPRYLEEHKEKILKYTMELAIQIKSGKATYSWNNTSAEAGIVYFKKNSYGEGIFGYKFVDNYLLYRYLNSDEIKKTIVSIITERKDADDYFKEQNELVYNKLILWWKLEDGEIEKFLLKMKSELEEKKYNPKYFKDIIVMLIQMKCNGLEGIDFDEYIHFMKIKLEDCKEPFQRQYLEIFSEDNKFVNMYNSISQPLFDIIDTKNKKNKEVLLCFFDGPWDDKFVYKCEKNRETYTRDGKFFFYMNPDKIIEKLNSSLVKNIYNFLEGIDKIYNFSNLNDFFVADVENISNLIKKIDIEKLSKGKHTRKIALTALKEKLEKSLRIIKS